MMTRRVSRLSRILVLTTIACVFLAQQASAQYFRMGRPHNDLVGSWIETVTVTGPGAPPPFTSLGVYNANGTSMFSDQGAVRLNVGQVSSDTVGSWSHLSNRTYVATFVTLICDVDGNLLASFKIRSELTLDRSGNSYTGRFRLEVFDPTGAPLYSTDGTTAARRILVERLP